ncbi:hypothetical protein AVEN_105877-1 [Araneus ventricosus]|uniref:Uncharacterized protein n=1 Tax=Araneus ventricosus TaxID=182803 RepID=A0A4Y2MTE3_ARAVE|nr:hypothetical protein AVEN_105877-1 [Araneus ventricosus]
MFGRLKPLRRPFTTSPRLANGVVAFHVILFLSSSMGRGGLKVGSRLRGRSVPGRSFTAAPHRANPSTSSHSDNLSPSSSSSSMNHTPQAPLASTYLFPPHLWSGNPNGVVGIKKDIHRCSTPPFLERAKAKPFVNVKSR